MASGRITAHMRYYGDDELLAILCGDIRIENLPRVLRALELPQGWIDAFRDLCELAAPEDRTQPIIPQWILDSLGKDTEDFYFEPLD